MTIQSAASLHSPDRNQASLWLRLRRAVGSASSAVSALRTRDPGRLRTSAPTFSGLDFFGVWTFGVWDFLPDPFAGGNGLDDGSLEERGAWKTDDGGGVAAG